MRLPAKDCRLRSGKRWSWLPPCAPTDLDLTSIAHERMMRVPRNMSRLLLSLGRRQRFRHRVLSAMERQNEAFEQMLAIHTGSSSGARVRPGTGLALRMEAAECVSLPEEKS